jgi:hypothetical protein
MFFPPKTKRTFFPINREYITANKAFSRQKSKVLSALLPCGVLKQAFRPLFSYGSETQTYGSF